MDFWLDIDITRPGPAPGDEVYVGARASGHRTAPARPLGVTVAILTRLASGIARAAAVSAPLHQEPAVMRDARALHRALFQGDLGATFEQVLAEARAQEQPLLVRLWLHDRALAAIPWEAACAPGEDFGFLGTNADLLVVRGVSSTDRWRPSEANGAILVLPIAPTGSEPALANLEEALRASVARGEIVLLEAIQGPATRSRNLSAALRARRRPHVVHFLGHGGVLRGVPSLALAGPHAESPEWEPAEAMAETLKAAWGRPLRPPQLVVLEACSGAAPGAFASAAEAFAGKGTGAVVAHLWPVHADVARDLSAELCGVFAGIGPDAGDIAASLTAARIRLASRNAAALSAVLYLRSPEPRLFEVGERRAPLPPVPGGGGLPKLHGVPFSPLGERFRGRDASLERIHEAFTDGNRRWVCIRGAGGIGKSRLAIEYVHRFHHLYPGGVYFVTVGAGGPLDFWAEMGRSLGGEKLSPELAAPFFIAQLADPRPGRKLVVLDGVDASSRGDLMKRFGTRLETAVGTRLEAAIGTRLEGKTCEIWPLEALTHVQMLVTTRCPGFPAASENATENAGKSAIELEIRQLDDRAARDLLVDRARLAPADDVEEAAAAELAGPVLGGHPLALSIAGAYIGRLKHDISYAEYLAKVREKGLTASLERDGRYVQGDVVDHEWSIAATYQVSLGALDANRDPDEARALRLLEVASCLAPNVRVDRALLRRILQEQGAATLPTKEEVGRAAHRLFELSLLDAGRDDEAGRDKGDVMIHPLVADYTRSKAGAERVEAARHHLLVRLRDLFPDDIAEYWRIMRPASARDLYGDWLSPAREAHVKHVWEHTAHMEDEARSRLWRCLAGLHLHRGDLPRAREACQGARALDEKLADGDRADPRRQRRLAGSCTLEGHVLARSGDPLGALAAYTRSLDIRESLARTAPHDDECQHDLLVGYDRVVSWLIDAGLYDEALPMLGKYMDFAQRSPAHPSSERARRALSIGHSRLADIRRKQKRHDEALEACRASEKIDRELSLQDPRDAGRRFHLAASTSALGKVLLDKGDRDGALLAFRETLAIRLWLIEQDPSNASWQDDLLRAAGRFADMVADHAGAGALVARALGLRGGLGDPPFNPAQVASLGELSRGLLGLR